MWDPIEIFGAWSVERAVVLNIEEFPGGSMTAWEDGKSGAIGREN
jgi:hypothetical protein